MLMGHYLTIRCFMVNISCVYSYTVLSMHMISYAIYCTCSKRFARIRLPPQKLFDEKVCSSGE